MASDSERDSDRESFFADCDPTSGTDSAVGGRKRQLSIQESARQATAQQKRARRLIHSRRSRSPRDTARGSRPDAAGESPADRQPAVTLDAIQELIEAGNRKVIAALDAKFAQLSKRLDIVESECIEKDLEIKKLNAAVAEQKKENADLRERLEGIDLNRRLSSLIITCDDFGPRAQNEDIERRTVEVLNRRLPDLNLTMADIQVAHRLQNNNKVIVKFIRRRVRDDVFERRFDLFGRRPGRGHGGAGGGHQMSPLYMNESLTPTCQQIFNSLLQAKKPENGAKIASVFSRRGTVFCKKEKNGPNVPVRDQEQLRKILGAGARSPGRALDGRPGSSAGAVRPPPPAGAAPPPERRPGSGAEPGADPAPSAQVPAGPPPVLPPRDPSAAPHQRETSSAAGSASAVPTEAAEPAAVGAAPGGGGGGAGADGVR